MNVILSKFPAIPTTAERPEHSAAYSAWLIVAAVLPLLIWYVRRLNDGCDEPLGLISLGLGVLLAWSDRKNLHAGSKARSTGSILVLASALSIPWLPPLPRALIAVIGIACFYGVYRRIGLLSLLLLSLPVVASLQFWAGYPLRVATAEGVVQALRLTGAAVSRIGTGIAVAGKIIGVDPACSGVRLLWHVLVAASALAALHRLPWRRGLALLILAGILTIPANQLRALVLVIQTWRGGAESSLWHESAGLASAALILAVLWASAAKCRGREMPVSVESPLRRRHLAVLIFAAIAGPCLALGAPHPPLPESAAPAFTEFTFEGVTLPLQPLPSTPMEQAFAATFPGSLGSYGWSGRQVILRRVTTATRRLHPSRDCLRAAGYDTTEPILETHADGSQWASFTATRDEWKLRVRERIISEANTASWTDPSAWYLHALFHPLNGPWRAETVIEVN